MNLGLKPPQAKALRDSRTPDLLVFCHHRFRQSTLSKVVHSQKVFSVGVRPAAGLIPCTGKSEGVGQDNEVGSFGDAKAIFFQCLYLLQCLEPAGLAKSDAAMLYQQRPSAWISAALTERPQAATWPTPRLMLGRCLRARRGEGRRRKK